MMLKTKFTGLMGCLLLGAISLVSTGALATPISISHDSSLDIAGPLVDDLNGPVVAATGTFTSFLGVNTCFTGCGGLFTWDDGLGQVLTYQLGTMSIDYESTNLLAVSGWGFFTLSDISGILDTAEGGFALTANCAGRCEGGYTSYSASFAVPEPATLALFGLGLLGLGIARRKKAD